MVDTMEKPKSIVIPPSTASETVITLPQMGSYKLGNPSYRGDHHVHIQVPYIYSLFPNVSHVFR